MSNIILTKNTLEITKETKIIEVPNYQPQLDAIDKLKGEAAKVEKEAIKTVNIVGNSIVEQVACYLEEMLSPVIQYYNDKNIPIPESIQWYCSGWELIVYKNSSMMLYYKDYNNAGNAELSILFNSDSYNILCNNDNDGEVIYDLTERWSDFKGFTKQTIERLLSEIKLESESKLNRNINKINALVNFEL